MMRQVPRGLLLLLLLATVGCSPKVRELARVASPDNTVEAVMAIKETDATVATPTEVYLVGRGQSLPSDPVFRADHVDGLSVHWTSARHLVVHASNARVFLRQGTMAVPSQAGASQVLIEYRVDHEAP